MGIIKKKPNKKNNDQGPKLPSIAHT